MDSMPTNTTLSNNNFLRQIAHTTGVINKFGGHNSRDFNFIEGGSRRKLF